MKEIKLLILMLLVVAVTCVAQNRVISYRQISCFCPQTGSLVPGQSMSTYVEFYDGYIYHPMYGKLSKYQTNLDGSITYVPVSYTGSPGYQLNAILISSDYQRLEERVTTSCGYMSANMINTYTSMGEGRAASDRWLDAVGASKRGGSSSRDRDSSACKRCGGTGVSKTPNTGGSRSNWVAYYNTNGVKCPYCGSYTSHYHDRCSSCNVPR